MSQQDAAPSFVPEGFKPYCVDHTFNDVVAPLYLKTTDDQPIIGMLVEKKHCNYVGMAHGGCLMTFSDIVLSGAVSHALGKYTSTPTINLSFDFMSAANEGDWIWMNILSVKLTRTMGFVNAIIEKESASVVRVSGTFKVPEDLDKFPGMDKDEYIAWRTSEPA